MTLEPILDGLRSPLAAVAAHDGSNRIFVVEKGGTIRIVRDGALLPDPFLDISGAVTGGGEQGLLGLAFHPDFPDDPRFFVNYTDTSGDTRVSSFTVDASNSDLADPDSEVEVLFIDQPYANHNGGALAFGPDGYLYIGVGDGGSGRITVGDEVRDVRAGSIVFVPATVPHRFHDITEELNLLVAFGPAEGSRGPTER